MSIRKAQDDVKQWRLHVGLANGVSPQIPDEDTAELHQRLIQEEANEAWCELADAPGWAGESPVDQANHLSLIAKELVDTIFVCLGCAADLGIDLEPVWEAVVESNMTKTGEQDGSGKIVKGDNYVAPDIQSIIRRQMRGAEV